MSVDIFTPKFMMKAYEQIPPVRPFLKDTFFRRVVPIPTKTVEYDIRKGGSPMAPFVGNDTGATVLERGKFKTIKATPPLIAPMRIVSWDDINHRLPGESQYNGLRPTQRLVELLQQDMIELDNAITRREEWMCAQMLFNGFLRLKGEGIDELIETEFSNRIAAKIPWSDHVNSTPIDDLFKAASKATESGITANIAIGHRETIINFVRNKEVQRLLDNRRFEMGSIDPEVLKNGVTYYGWLPECNLELYSYNEEYKDNDNINPKYPTIMPSDAGFIPAKYPLIPKGKIFVGSTNMPAMMAYAVIGDAATATSRPRVPVSWLSPGINKQRYTVIQSRPLPCPIDIDTWVILEVL